MRRLKSHSIVPPGEFWYQQAQGIQHKFGPGGDITAIAADIFQFRAANRLERASYAESLEDVDTFVVNCLRQRSRATFEKYTFETDKPFGEIAPSIRNAPAACATCGGTPVNS